MGLPDDSTEELLRRAELADEDAVRELWQRHRRRLGRMIAARMDRRVAARIDASDIIQEAMIVASLATVS
jgi:RNA polymerase sigma-70 factor (ECF subfamily)